MPRHPTDTILRPYVAGESWPPEAEDELRAVADRVFARTETPTGTHDLRVLIERVKAKENADVKDELERIKKERADAADRRQKFWDDVKKAVVIAVVLSVGGGLAGASYKIFLLIR